MPFLVTWCLQSLGVSCGGPIYQYTLQVTIPHAPMPGSPGGGHDTLWSLEYWNPTRCCCGSSFDSEAMTRVLLFGDLCLHWSFSDCWYQHGHVSACPNLKWKQRAFSWHTIMWGLWLLDRELYPFSHSRYSTSLFGGTSSSKQSQTVL